MPHMVSSDMDHDRYAALHTSDVPTYLDELEQETRRDVPVANMISGKVQGRFLSMLSHLQRPERAIELGTYTGYSALCIAEGLVPNGVLHTIEHHDRLIPIAQRFFDQSGLSEKIVLHHGDISDILPTIPGPFDLVFIDADKPNYDKYFDLLFDKIAPQGLIIADNVFWKGRVLDLDNNDNAQTRGMIRYAEKIKHDERLESVFLPVKDGLLLSRKK